MIRELKTKGQKLAKSIYLIMGIISSIQIEALSEITYYVKTSSPIIDQDCPFIKHTQIH